MVWLSASTIRDARRTRPPRRMPPPRGARLSPVRRGAAIAACVVASLVALACVVAVAPSSSTVQAQSPQAPLERRLTGGEMHSYRLTLTAGQFMRAVFDQRGIDVVVTLSGPDAKRVLEVDNPGGSWGPEPLFFEVEQEGSYKIEVRPRRDTAPPGMYLFSIEARFATRADRRRFPADRAFAEATRKLLDKTAECFEQGIAKYEEARRLYHDIGDRRGEITTLNTLACVSAALGRWETALNYYREALPLMRAARDRPLEAMTESNVAQVYYSLGDRPRALTHFQLARDIFRAVGDLRMTAYTYNNTGFVHDAMGETGHALENFNFALPLFRAAADRRGEAYTLNNIGLVYDQREEKRKAQTYYRQSLAIFEDIADCRELAPVLSNAASERLEEGDRRKALEYLHEALVIQRTVNDRQGEATTLNNIGFVYNTLNLRDKALEHLNQALTIHREVENRRGEGDTLGNLMFTYKADAQTPAAVFYGKQAVNVYQRVRAEIPPLDKEAQKSFIKSKETSYRQLADLLISTGRLLEAQQVLGLLKEEEYFNLVRRDGTEAASLTAPVALTPAEAEVDKQFRELSAVIAAYARERGELSLKTMRTPAEEQRLSELENKLGVAGQQFQIFITRLAAEFASAGRGREGVRQLEEAQGLQGDLSELGAGVVALYTLLGEEKYRIILVTPDVQLAREYPIKAADLFAKIADYRQVLQDPRLDPRPLAQELYRILVAPVARDLSDYRAETLMWSLDGALRYLPVAALHDGEKYLVERYRNVVFTPATMARLKDAPGAKWKALGFGVSKSVSDFAALPAVPDELRGIIRDETGDAALGGGIIAGQIRLDEAFTEEAFRTALRQRYPLVHIASHFSFQPGDETASFLLLGDGSKLTLARIKTAQQLFGGVELLTLSACDTATSSGFAGGKEVEGFGMLAQRQGAKAVLASLWPVSDESTRLLMEEFYRLRNAGAGMSKAAALQAAQRALLDGELKPATNRSSLAGGARAATARFTLNPGAPFSHPYFWSPFILIGNWR